MSDQKAILKDLVAIASTSGNEQVVSRYIVGSCRVPHIEVTQLGNSVALFVPGKSARNGFILSAHIDTIPPLGKWDTDPYILTEDELDPDKLYGLGASDNKSGVAVLLSMLETHAKQQPKYDVYYLFTEDEEIDNVGARRLARWLKDKGKEYEYIGGIVVEPTDGGEFIGIGHRNGLVLEVVARGTAGHGSQSLANSEAALEKLSYFISHALPEAREKLAKKYPHAILGLPTLNATRIETGNGRHNVIPGEAVLTLDFRSTPSLDAALPEELQLLEDTYSVKILSPRQPDPAFCPENTYIRQIVTKALPQTPQRAFPAATDMPYFLACGIPTVILGPGEMAVMHQPNEWVRLSNMIRCKAMIEKIIEAF